MKIKSVEMTFVDVIAKIALSDPDLLSEGQNLKNLYILYGRSWRTNVWETFVDFDICHQVV